MTTFLSNDPDTLTELTYLRNLNVFAHLVMNGSTLSTDQLRYLTLTNEYGLDHGEALHALGRRAGSAPEYRNRG